jgi:hypothetical protein
MRDIETFRSSIDAIGNIVISRIVIYLIFAYLILFFITLTISVLMASQTFISSENLYLEDVIANGCKKMDKGTKWLGVFFSSNI